MKEDIINVIKILGIGLNEVLVDIDLGFFYINSVEFRKPDEVILHQFEGDTDYEISYDELNLIDRIEKNLGVE